jgi:hypothetical protein
VNGKPAAVEIGHVDDPHGKGTGIWPKTLALCCRR